MSDLTTERHAKQVQGRIRLEFLDGIRGLAAISVLMFHLWIQVFTKDGEHGPSFGTLPGLWKWTAIFSFGSYAVPVFIVLSGFCLMLPLARSDKKELPGGFRNYIQRRMRRILPPYYAALLLFSFAEFVILPRFFQKTGGHTPTPSFASLIAHFFLLHNLNTNWARQIDSPMWSVATEWQIYFIFPALLLPLQRRFGNLIPILAGLILGGVTLLSPILGSAAFWFIGLFAMGMAGAVTIFSPKITERVRRIPWGLLVCLSGTIALGSMCLVKLVEVPQTVFGGVEVVAVDAIVGLATTFILIYCTHFYQFNNERRPPILMRIFCNPWTVWLGVFSYSIYLVHSPILSLIGRITRHITNSTPLIFLALISVGIPLAIGLSYLFHLAFERRFMNMPPEKKLIKVKI